MDMVRRGDMMSIDDVTEILSINLIGAIPDDEQVVIGTNQGEPVIDMDSLAGHAYMNICPVSYTHLNRTQMYSSGKAEQVHFQTENSILL